MKRIVIFASGSGTNAQNIIECFQKSDFAKVTLVLSNKKNAKVLERAKFLNVPSNSFSKEDLSGSDRILNVLLNEKPEIIVLAGFLLKFPEAILNEFPNKVINIHPALLPKYGGKGMYGSRVHESVIENNETETGVTIHYVNENYDEGAIIFQKKVIVSENDTPDSVAKKVHELEYEFFPKVIKEVLLNNK